MDDLDKKLAERKKYFEKMKKALLQEIQLGGDKVKAVAALQSLLLKENDLLYGVK